MARSPRGCRVLAGFLCLVSSHAWAAVETGEAAASVKGIGGGIGFQCHSYDDLREWTQIFIKATQYLKVDPQWAPQSFCAGQVRANQSDPRGCLLLNHDTLWVGRTDYNTTDDVLSYLADPANAGFFTRPDRRIYLSLCFKGCGSTDTCPCDGAPDSASWLSLVDDFVAAANATISRLGLNVEFLLDGNGNPGSASCLAQRWRPVNSVFITGDDPDAAFTSNDPALGYDRLQVLNEDTDSWPGAVAADYGKFVNSSYTYLIWEPSDQPSIWNYSGE
jgi:hypothetical protein